MPHFCAEESRELALRAENRLGNLLDGQMCGEIGANVAYRRRDGIGAACFGLEMSFLGAQESGENAVKCAFEHEVIERIGAQIASRQLLDFADW